MKWLLIVLPAGLIALFIVAGLSFAAEPAGEQAPRAWTTRSATSEQAFAWSLHAKTEERP